MRISDTGNVAITFCKCNCCVRAFDLCEDGQDPQPACRCKGFPPTSTQDPECLCWFCVEANS